MANKYLGVPDNDDLVVTGTGLSPQVSRSPSPDSSSLSDSGTERSEDYTVLDGVREMNEMLLKQIQAIRRQIDISEKTNNDEKAKLLASKNTQLRQKDNEINNLTHSLQSKDEKIQQLKKIGAEKDKLIQDKGVEVENLKSMVEQIQDKAKKIHKKVKRAQRKTPARTEDDNATERLQDDEIFQLRSEMEELKVQVATLEAELAKAVEVIKEQNERMGIMSEEKKDMEAKLSEKFKQMSESMRRDVERTCQVLLKNNEEMQQLKQQTSRIHNELSDLKMVLVQQRGDKRTADNAKDLTVDETSENLCNREQVLLTTVNQTQKLPSIPTQFKSIPKIQRESSQYFTSSNQKNDFTPSNQKNDFTPSNQKNDFTPSNQKNDFTPSNQKNDFTPNNQKNDFTPKNQKNDFTPSIQKNGELQSSYNATKARLHTHYQKSDQAKRSVSHSADATTATTGRSVRVQNYPTSSFSVQTLRPPAGANINRKNVIPPITQKAKQGKLFSSQMEGVKRDPKK